MSEGEAPLGLVILDDVVLRRGSTTVDLSTLERSLLARTALSTSVSVDSLQPWLWGEDPPASARNRVQALVSSLRRKVGEPLLVTRGSSYRLAPTVTTDLAAWNALLDRARALRVTDPEAGSTAYHQAFAIFSGTPLVGIPPTDSVEAEREHLTQMRLAAIEESVDVALALGHADHQDLLLQPLVEENPFRESLIARLIRVLAASGRQEEALRTYREAHRRLDEELGVSPSGVLRQAHAEALRVAETTRVSAPAVMGRSEPLVATIVPTLPPPRTIPRHILDFVGREEDLAAILEAADRVDQTAVVVSVTGLVGMGKSALAILAAHRLRDRFPGGSLYVDASVDPVGSDPYTVGAALLGLLGLSPDAIPEPPAERAALVRSVLDDRRVLLVLDNVDPDLAPAWKRMSDLLPGGPGSMAIITSRHPLPGLGSCVPVHLLSLDPPARLDLLARIVGQSRVDADPAGAEQLVDATGGIPLSLRLVASRIASRPDADFTYASRVMDRETGLPTGDESQQLRAALQAAWERLPTDARDVAELMVGLDLGTITDWVPGALLADEARGDTAMDALLESSFVEPVVSPDRFAQYRLHQVVHLLALASGHTSKDAQRQARKDLVHSLFERCCEQARHVPTQFLPYPPRIGATGERADLRDSAPSAAQRHHAIRFFRTEAPTICRSAVDVLEQDPALAWRLLSVTSGALTHVNEMSSWLQACHEVRSRLPDDDDGRLGTAVLAIALAKVHQDQLGSSREALTLVTEANHTLVTVQWSRHLAASALISAGAHTSLGDAAAARQDLDRAASLLARAPDAVLSGWGAIGTALVHNDYDEVGEAAEHNARARALLEPTPAGTALALAGLELARSRRRLGDLSGASAMIDDVLRSLVDMEDNHLYPYALDCRAEVSIETGDAPRGLVEATRAGERARAAHDRFLTARSRRTRAAALAGVGRLPEAAEELRASIRECLDIGRPLSAAAALNLLRQVLDALHDPEGAALARQHEHALRAAADLADGSAYTTVLGSWVVRPHPDPRTTDTPTDFASQTDIPDPAQRVRSAGAATEGTVPLIR